MRILAHKQRRDETRTNSKQRGARRHARRISKTSIIVASLRLSPFDHFRRVNSHRRGILVVFSLLVLYLYMLYMVGCIWFWRRRAATATSHQPIHFQPVHFVPARPPVQFVPAGQPQNPYQQHHTFAFAVNFPNYSYLSPDSKAAKRWEIITQGEMGSKNPTNFGLSPVW